MDQSRMTNQGFHTRLARLSDITQIVKAVCSLRAELRGVISVEATPEAEDVCRRIIEGRSSGAIFVACTEDERLAGIVTLSIQEAIRVGGSYGLIQELWVHPEHRNNAVGARLIEAVEDYCRKEGLGNIEVGLPGRSFPQHQQTYNFYQRCGFVEQGPRMRKVSK
jgi:branched-chain amino acid aminotransferase